MNSNWTRHLLTLCGEITPPAFLIAAASVALADTVDIAGQTVYGLVVSIDKTTVQLDVACHGPPKPFRIDELVSIRFDALCQKPDHPVFVSPATFEPKGCHKETALSVRLADNTELWANEIRLTRDATGTLKLWLRGGAAVEGPLGEAEWISRKTVCVESMKQGQVPLSYKPAVQSVAPEPIVPVAGRPKEPCLDPYNEASKRPCKWPSN